MACDTEQVDAIEACRTCGIYYMSTTNYLKPLFQSAVDYPEMMLIRLELAQWKVEINESDGLPQFLCSSCIHEFQKVFKFRSSCIDTQDQLRAFYNLREENLANLKIKTEMIEPGDDVDTGCNFIYVDDFSDGEYDSVTPFNIPHVPIKEELIEAATVPREDDQTKPSCVTESASAGGAGTEMPQVGPALSQCQNEYVAPPADRTAFVLDPQMSQSTTTNVECELCQHISPNTEEHKQHTKRVHANRDMECHICGKVFKNTTQTRFKFHLKWHNINKHVKCPQCGFVCTSRQGLKEHKRAVHAKIFCKICGKGVLAKKMKGHLRDHEIVKQFPCEYCTEVLLSEKERETHIWQVHANDNSNDNENPHHLQHVGTYDKIVNVEVICAQCNEKFVHQSELEQHVKLVHFKSQLQRQHLVDDCDESVIMQDIQTPSDSMAMHHNASSSTSDCGKYNNDEPIEEDARESSNENITVFEGYDDDEEDTEEETKFMPNLNSSATTQQQQPYFTRIHSNIQNANYLDDNDKGTIENFSQQESETNSSLQERYSETESENEIDSNSTFIPNDIPQYACAKCTNTFNTVETLREHYKCHQVEQTAKVSPTKSKFKCDICDKQFDLKFSLNRHMKKHKNEDASQ